jgi:hypothetical protein
LTGGRKLKLVSLLEKKRVGCGCMSALLGFLHFSKIVSRTPAFKEIGWFFSEFLELKKKNKKKKKQQIITFVGTFIGVERMKDILDQN